MNLFIMQNGEIKSSKYNVYWRKHIFKNFWDEGRCKFSGLSGYVCKNKIRNEAVNAAQSIVLVKTLICCCPVEQLCDPNETPLFVAGNPLWESSWWWGWWVGTRQLPQNCMKMLPEKGMPWPAGYLPFSHKTPAGTVSVCWLTSAWQEFEC